MGGVCGTRVTLLQMRPDVHLGVFVIFDFVSYMDPIYCHWAEMPVTGRSERLRNRQCGALKGCRAEPVTLVSSDPHVGTPPITIGAFERKGACPQLVLESCARALHFKNWVKIRFLDRLFE